MFSAASVCQFVCLSVDTITSVRLNVKVKGQRSRSPGTKKLKTAESFPFTVHSKACAERRTLHAAAEDTIASQLTAVHADDGLRERFSGARSSASSTPVGKSAQYSCRLHPVCRFVVHVH